MTRGNTGPTVPPLDIDRCPRCNTPTHASESGDDGVCAACLASEPKVATCAHPGCFAEPQLFLTRAWCLEHVPPPRPVLGRRFLADAYSDEGADALEAGREARELHGYDPLDRETDMVGAPW